MSKIEIFGYLLMGIGAVYAAMMLFALYLAVKYRLPLLGMPGLRSEPPYRAPPRYRR